MTRPDNTPLHEPEYTRLGDLVLVAPESSRVLLRHELDFCCGGDQSLAAACEAKGIDVAQIVSELREVEQGPPIMDWDAAPLEQIIEHIVHVYHAPIPEDLAQIIAMAEKVLTTHGHKDPIRLTKLRDCINDFADEIQFHMEKEEVVLFPRIINGGVSCPRPPIVATEAEHLQAAASLTEFRDLTDDYQPPEGACATWCNLYARLENFDHTLRAHIHLENHVLFPRARSRG